MQQQSIVLGLPHRDYGEIPVAILESHAPCAFASDSEDGAVSTYSKRPLAVSTVYTGILRPVHDTVRRQMVSHLGAEYTLGGFTTLRDLGYSEWPLNGSGKLDRKGLRTLLSGRVGV